VDRRRGGGLRPVRGGWTGPASLLGYAVGAGEAARSAPAANAWPLEPPPRLAGLVTARDHAAAGADVTATKALELGGERRR